MLSSGDLNYRIDLTRSIVQANIRTGNIGTLLEHDQLLKELKTNQAFRLRSFNEAGIGFLPTYKFDPWVQLCNQAGKPDLMVVAVFAEERTFTTALLRSGYQLGAIASCGEQATQPLRRSKRFSTARGQLRRAIISRSQGYSAYA